MVGVALISLVRGRRPTNIQVALRQVGILNKEMRQCGAECGFLFVALHMHYRVFE